MPVLCRDRDRGGEVNAEPGEIVRMLDEGAQMRVGRKLKRTLYLKFGDGTAPDIDLCVGIVDSEVLAAEIVERWNR